MPVRYKTDNCIVCNEEYNRYNNNRFNVCSKCRPAFYNERVKEKYHFGNADRKHLYPFGINAQRRRYTLIRRKLDECETREQLKEFYNWIIADMVELGIWDWCCEKTENTYKPKKFDENGNPMIGRCKVTRTDLPDTRNMPE